MLQNITVLPMPAATTQMEDLTVYVILLMKEMGMSTVHVSIKID
jgi:hypothetical protein